MPLKLSPTQVAFNARGDGSFNQPFVEQLAFFRQKLNLPTEHYDDILGAAHDRAFVVAGAMKADLLSDLRQSVDKAIAEGKSIQWFRANFKDLVKKNGWEGYTGSETKAGRDWRTRVIYRTNMASSYAAGRWQQLNHPDLLASRPYLKYIHNDTVSHPRPLHVSWSGLVLKADDPFWHSHFPPNGWGCRCRVTAVRASEYNGANAPDDGVFRHEDSQGVTHTVPEGIDFGWDYAPGRSNAELIRQVIAKQDKADWHLARDNVSALVGSEVFGRFFNGSHAGEFPLAVLSPKDKALLGADTQTVLISRESIAEHLVKHPEITLDDYRAVQEMIDKGALYKQGDTRLIYIIREGVTYRAALKRTGDGSKNYFLSLFKNERGKPPANAIEIKR